MNIVLKSSCIFDSIGSEPFAGYIEIEGNKIKEVVRGETDKYNGISAHPHPKIEACIKTEIPLEAKVRPESGFDDRSEVKSEEGTGNAATQPPYKLIDLGDRTVTPGLIDSHIHLFLGSMHAATVDLYEANSQEEAARMLYDFYEKGSASAERSHNSDRSLPTDWVIGFRWCNYRWPGEALPSKEALDKYFPDRPVIAFNNELHAVWVNSKTMELCGIDKDTPTPQGGIIERDENGEPTGFFLEQPAMEMVTRKALDASPELEEKMIKIFMDVAHSKGITSVGAVHVMRIMKHKACRRLENRGELKMRVFFAPHMEMDIREALELKKEYASDKLRFMGLKGFVDGTPLGYTGYMVEPYKDRPGFRSEPLVDPEWLMQKSKECYKNGIAMRLHACGDAAVRLALDAYEAARREYGEKDIRNAIEHIEVIHEDDIPRLAATNTVASIQPSHIVIDSLDIHPAFLMLDDARIKLSWMGRTLQENGAVVAFGTDYPIVDLDPVDTIYRAVTRRMGNDTPADGWNPQEKFTVAEAITNSTRTPAYLMQMEDRLGTLEPGKLADINVFSRNIFSDIDNMLSTRTDMTIFDGEIVYDAGLE